MIKVNDELRIALDDFFKCFGYNVPLFQIPSKETNENLILNINRCVGDKKDHLKEIYDFKYSEEIHY